VREDQISLTEQEEKIIEFLKAHNNQLRTKDAKSVLGVEARRAREVLKDLVDKQVIIKKSKGPSTFYEKK